MAIKYIEKKRLIDFIANMKRTGITASDALIHFAKEITTNQELKQVAERIAKNVRKGFDIEVLLHNEKIINDLQYAVLSNSQDKNEAYDNIASYADQAKEADKLYKSSFQKIMFVWIASILTMTYLIDVYGGLAEQLKESKQNYHLTPIFDLILSSSSFLYILVVVLIFCTFFGLVFYKSSYETSITAHYRIFRLKALDDGLLYLKMINDMLASGNTTVEIFDILAKHMYPISARPVFKEIASRLKKNLDVSDLLTSLGMVEDAVFTVQTARVMQDVPGGFQKAYNVTMRALYKQEMRKEYLEKLNLIFFGAFNLPLFLLSAFIVYAQIQTTF